MKDFVLWILWLAVCGGFFYLMAMRAMEQGLIH